MPSWGRPPGAKGSRRRRQWEREQGFWNEARVEELDSDDTDTQGVGLNYDKKRFASDPLHFTGGDLGSASRVRRSYAFGDSEDSSGDSIESEVEGTDALQIALRDKEEALVQSALARIRRAQEKGKREVKLNQDELNALENRRKRMQAAATAKARKGSGSGGGSDRQKRRRSDRISVPISAATEAISRPSSRPSSRRDITRSKRSDEVPHPPAAANPPGMLVAGPDGLAYAPLGTYPSNSSLSNSQPPSRNSPSRPRSATTQQLRGQPPPIPYFSHQQPPNSRHFSEGMRPASSSSNSSRRPLPDEADWQPTNSRRSSAASSHSQGFMVDPFDYQVSSDTPPPIPSQYQQQAQQGRRHVSNPADISYSSISRTPPGYPPSAQTSSRFPAASSDPSLRHRSSRGPGAFESSSEEEDESDDLGNGVQVFVEEEREPEREREREREKDKAVARKPVGGRKRGKR
ncbi:hypothetical protein ONS95_008229 [Cadophora gregata]|uniref:uncharacterized protein n=1 Tax=Cadophora gregata TaxID=51156 RepID=UPI0026DC9EC6|nr:uncharacterized protein ONS95_008229 [Cadophora gregata]KAK0100269.1 hypothetical protein ONS96_007552 [Cadophora gregata f. sp. sojae]KAK0126645.1 hypothetical protein ONS95_008229 [Cadophora gregata]